MVVTDTTASSSKFSGFSITKAKTLSNANKRKEPEEEVDYIKDITGNKITSIAQEITQGPKIIPLSMQLPSFKKHKPNSSSSTITTTNISAKQTEDKVKSLDELAAEQVIRDVTEKKEEGSEDQVRIVPLCMQNQVEGIEDISDETLRFKHDVNNRPDDPTIEAYDDMPIDSFGEAMMRGMGWSPGGLIGMNNRGLSEPIEFVKRAGNRLGLGATPKELLLPSSSNDDSSKKKIIKPGESRDPKKVMVAKPGPDGKTRHVKAISESLVPLVLGLSIGQKVYIIKGRHVGLSGHIVLIKQQWKEKVSYNADDDFTNNNKIEDVYIRLSPSEEEVVVPSDYLSSDKPSISRYSRSSVGAGDGDGDVIMTGCKSSKSSKKESSSSWLRSNIKVRVVSKSYEEGKYYNKKGTIVDVIGDKLCIVQLDDGPLLDKIKQRNVETVIPQPKGIIMVVSGSKFLGRTGCLLSKNLEEATVQLTGDFSVSTFSLDDIAQFVGDVDDDDY